MLFSFKWAPCGTSPFIIRYTQYLHFHPYFWTLQVCDNIVENREPQPQDRNYHILDPSTSGESTSVQIHWNAVHSYQHPWTHYCIPRSSGLIKKELWPEAKWESLLLPINCQDFGHLVCWTFVCGAWHHRFKRNQTRKTLAVITLWVLHLILTTFHDHKQNCLQFIPIDNLYQLLHALCNKVIIFNMGNKYSRTEICARIHAYLVARKKIELYQEERKNFQKSHFYSSC